MSLNDIIWSAGDAVNSARALLYLVRNEDFKAFYTAASPGDRIRIESFCNNLDVETLKEMMLNQSVTTQDYSHLKTTELREVAKNRGITGYASFNKLDLIVELEEDDALERDNGSRPKV